MISPVLDEPACPDGAPSTAEAEPTRRLVVVRSAVAEIEPAVWDGLAARTPWATPFSSHGFHRAWWEAYADNAHEETLLVLDPQAPHDANPVAIVPLMHRHGVEPSDAATHTTIRGESDAEMTPVPPHAKVIFFGASYHADYATVLTDPVDLPDVARAVARFLAIDDDEPGFAMPWDLVDLRRLRCGDPAADVLGTALAAAGERGAAGERSAWTVAVEREDVCPVIPLPAGGGIDDFLATLDKKARHEIRRKVRRAEAAGEVRYEISAAPLDDLEAFIDLHQKRWGERGLFPETPGGSQSRVLVRRLFELLPPETIRLAFLTVDGRRIAAGITFRTGDTDFYYNAGVDPDAFALSPGVLLLYRTVVAALADGQRRLDMLRGDEPYKYEWGAVDEPIQRILVRRRTD